MTDIAIEYSERALIHGLRSGHEAAFAHVISRCTPSQPRLATSYVRSRAVAEEVVQEAPLGVLRGIERFEGRSSSKTWIFCSAVNVAKTRATRKARSLPFSALADEPTIDPQRSIEGRWASTPTNYERLERCDAVRCLEVEITSVPAHQRQAITLRNVCGLSSAEVCDPFDLAPEKRRVLLYRVPAKARAALEQLQLDERPVRRRATSEAAASTERRRRPS